ncbi:hypothetical protein FIBSPDRAFT_593579 [Athelia psychrophila]|uniref:F-box domain-containing protein n=1 Tax=Athelia psychrophila TaxID=1759441 RepID=A0A166H611_9AGAM|nr:hypothetical protein FIBSPDRAFT_593579 [Fibularhizoctonia sp. CBS 109695]
MMHRSDTLTTAPNGDNKLARYVSTSPIDRLPNELLAHMFRLGAASACMPVGGLEWQLPFALLVSSISRRWREVAVSSQPLWSQISFADNRPSDIRWCADLFLPRSGTHPLDITIHVQTQFNSMERVLEAILPHCARWRRLCVKPWNTIQHDPIWAAIQDIAVPLLQHIEIRYTTDFGTSLSHEMPSFTLGSPALRSVRLRGGLRIPSGPPLANLTTCRLSSKYYELSQPQLESIICSSPALRVLNLYLERFEASGNGMIFIPCLLHLSLNLAGNGIYGDPDTILLLLAIITAPTLESLEIGSLNTHGVDILRGYCQQYPQYPRPHKLKLFDIKIAGAEWQCTYDTLFDLFPTVTSLYITGTFKKPSLSHLPALKAITYNLRTQLSTRLRPRDDDCIQWICRHAEDCKGTSHTMESVRLGDAARKVHREVDYQRLRDLVDFVELADDTDSLHGSWDSDEEMESEYGDVFGRARDNRLDRNDDEEIWATNEEDEWPSD